MLYLALPFLLLMLFYAAYLVRMAWHFGRLPLQQRAGVEANPPSITVIVPARNEAAHVGACVRAILQQNYPPDRLQLIVVNDHSEDATVAEALAAAGQDTRLSIVHLGPQMGTAYKKAAVAAGIAQAQGEWIVTTDADCIPGRDWLQAMSANFGEGVAMVSGPVMLKGEGLFCRFQALEFMGLIAVGAGAIAAGQPTMCNGANLAYRRRAFEEVGGFAGIDHIASGDDELLMHKMAGAGRTVRFAKSKAAIVQTPAQATWAGFKAQRIRWVSKSTHYKRPGITLTLMLSYLAMTGFPVLAVAGIWEPWLFACLGALLLLKMAGEAAVLFQAAAFFDNLRLLWYFPLEQAAHVAYILWVGLAGNRKAYTWKGRTVK
jgi:cellulose synthase/poly-beta-1,6-N-acetylglucosamine synthase-like glycosyltransferase